MGMVMGSKRGAMIAPGISAIFAEFSSPNSSSFNSFSHVLSSHLITF